MLPGAAAAARPGSSEPPAFELRSKGKALGQVAPVLVDGGQAYLSAARLAAVLRGSWIARGERASLTVGSRSAHFTRGAAGVVVQGQTIGLGSSPRILATGWLLPDDFLVNGLGRLVPGVTAVKLAMASVPRGPGALGVDEARRTPPARWWR